MIVAPGIEWGREFLRFSFGPSAPFFSPPPIGCAQLPVAHHNQLPNSPLSSRGKCGPAMRYTPCAKPEASFFCKKMNSELISPDGCLLISPISGAGSPRRRESSTVRV